MIRSFSENDLVITKEVMLEIDVNEDLILRSLYLLAEQDKKKEIYESINKNIKVDVITQEIIQMKKAMENVDHYNKIMRELKTIYGREEITMNIKSWTSRTGETNRNTTIVTYINCQNGEPLLNPIETIRIQYENNINEFDFDLAGIYV